jgi:carboxyvinyl-carboxyphosphonate phosphorylmutase
MAAIRAVHDTLKALRQGAKPNEIGGGASEALLQQVTRDKDYKAWTKEFLS